MRFMVSIVMALTLLCGSPPLRASDLDFDDIQFWVGDGEHRAALVIDWWHGEGEGSSTLWGYRWSGSETINSNTLLQSIVAADERLYMKSNGTTILFGLGYDEPGDVPFAVSDGTQFDEHGIAIAAETLGATAVDPADRYADGWEDGYWVHAVANSSPYVDGGWARSNFNLSTQAISDGMWNGWTFTDKVALNQLMLPIYPDPPTPASLRGVGELAGDLNGDGAVNLADYTVWRDTNGDASLYTVWKQNFGAPLVAGTSAGVSVPEPNAVVLGTTALLGLLAIGRRFTSERLSCSL